MRAPVSLLAAVLLAAASAAPAVTETLFEEGFSNVNNNSLSATTYLTGSVSGESDFQGDNTVGAWHGKSIAVGPSAIRFGNASNQGWARTPAIAAGDDSEPVTVSFSAASYPEKFLAMSVSLLDANNNEIAGTSTNFALVPLTDTNDKNIDGRTSDTNGTPLAVSFDNVPSSFKIQFASAQKDSRVFLGHVLVMRERGLDPWEPVWTVGEPSPAPRVGAAFSFGVSAALADDTPQTVSYGGLTPAATGAQPTFANGVFSWTPGADAAGNYTAAFSVQNTGGTYTTNVAFAVRGATEERTLFWEDFPNYTYAWSYANGPVTFPTTDTRQPGWTGNTCYKARSAMRLGKASDYGSATTPAIETANAAPATVTLTLDAAAYAGKTSTLGITAVDTTTSAVLFSSNVVLSAMSGDTLMSLSGYPIGPFSFAAAGTFKITFARASGDGRMSIDSVKVVQSVSTLLDDLAVPTGLAVVDGTLSTNSFSVAWNAVGNATGYGVQIRTAGDVDWTAVPSAASTTAAFADLPDDTDWEVRVRAQGDTSLYNFSDWTNVVVHTARSALHPTLSFDGWTNSVGNGNLYAGIANVAAVTAVRDNGTDAAVAFTGIAPASPVPIVGPTFEDGVLSWIPVDEDTNKTFTVSFLMDGTYVTNLSFKVLSVPLLHPAAVTVDPIAWNAFGLSWDHQYRAAGYAVRVWTDCPNPGATATRVEEYFKGYFKKNGGGARPVGWLFDVDKEGYNNSTTPVKLDESGSWIASYDLGGAITSVTFTVQGNTMKEGSTLRAYWTGALTDEELENPDNRTNNVVVAVTDLVSHSQTVTAQIPANYEARRIVWQYEKHYGTVGVGSVAIEGTGFSTPRWLPGWGPVAKDLGLVQGCTVKKPRPGKVLGVNPANKKEDLTEPRANYAEVTVRDAAGATRATVVAVEVPAPPRSARASMMILR